MRILLIGSGGREHALAFKMSQSRRLTKLFVAPGNGGTARLAENVELPVDRHDAVIAFCRKESIDLVVVGPEAPLVAGIADALAEAGILVFGPSREAAQLEGSKAFTKALCDEMGIPTAAYRRFASGMEALDYVQAHGAPIVVKADGLAAGKGVTVAMSVAEAETAIHDCFGGTFGEAGAEVVIEDLLVGEEVSVFAVSDGERFVVLEAAQDHKRAFDFDQGPNTGGMGAYSPPPVMNATLMEQIKSEIIAPTIAGMKRRGTPFKGVLFAGLMITTDGPRLIEYNVRFGDPECQVLMMRLASDLIDLLEAVAVGDLTRVDPQWHEQAALTVVMAAKGYPGAYRKGSEIRGADDLDSDVVRVFHAGTIRQGRTLLASGGRVLNVTALGDDVQQARDRAYAAADAIDWPEGFFRRDIGWRAIGRE